MILDARDLYASGRKTNIKRKNQRTIDAAATQRALLHRNLDRLRAINILANCACVFLGGQTYLSSYVTP